MFSVVDGFTIIGFFLTQEFNALIIPDSEPLMGREQLVSLHDVICNYLIKFFADMRSKKKWMEIGISYHISYIVIL